MNMKKAKPLDDLEIHELLSLIYPEHIKSDDDEYFHLSQEIGETEIPLSDYGDTCTLAELLGRVVMLTMPMKSAICGKYSHSWEDRSDRIQHQYAGGCSPDAEVENG